MQIKRNEVFFKVKDFTMMRVFYEKLLNCKSDYVYGERWASIEGWLGLYNPQFDLDAGIELDETESIESITGTNTVVCFLTDDIEASKEFLIEIGGQNIGKTMMINNTKLYRYYHFRDPEGNLLEMGKYE